MAAIDIAAAMDSSSMADHTADDVLAGTSQTIKRERDVENLLKFNRLCKAARTGRQLSPCASDEHEDSSHHDAQKPLDSAELREQVGVTPPPQIAASQPQETQLDAGTILGMFKLGIAK